MSDLTIPVDDSSLNLILEATNAAYVVDDNGEHTIVGADYTIHQLLEFWSGYDTALEIDQGDGVSYYPHPVLSHTDIIRALIAEIHRLRGNDE